jgi:hypothetical protein
LKGLLLYSHFHFSPFETKNDSLMVLMIWWSLDSCSESVLWFEMWIQTLKLHLEHYNSDWISAKSHVKCCTRNSMTGWLGLQAETVILKCWPSMHSREMLIKWTLLVWSFSRHNHFVNNQLISLFSDFNLFKFTTQIRHAITHPAQYLQLGQLPIEVASPIIKSFVAQFKVIVATDMNSVPRFTYLQLGNFSVCVWFAKLGRKLWYVLRFVQFTQNTKIGEVDTRKL